MTTPAELSSPSADVRPTSGVRALRYAVPLGRLLYALIFVTSGLFHFSSGALDYARSNGVPAAGLLVPLSGLLALAGGLSVMLGVKARWGAALLVLFLLPVTLM